MSNSNYNNIPNNKGDESESHHSQHSHHTSGSHHSHSSEYYHHSSSSSSGMHRHSSGSSSSHRHHSLKSSEDMFNSDAERRGENIIYKNVRKNKIFMMIKRGSFCVISIAILIFVIYSIIYSAPGENLKFFSSNRVRTEELNELKIKIVQYEERIEELENRLAQYEDIEKSDDTTEKE